MSENIEFTATLKDSPFVAGMARIRAAMGGGRTAFTEFGATAKTETVSVSQQISKFSDSLRQEMAGIGGHFSGLFESLSMTRGGFIALGVALAGVGFKKAADHTAQITESAMELARVLGTTTNVAQAHIIALEDIGATQEEFQAGAKGMSKQLKENEADMQAMGLQTRDSAGNLRPLNELMLEGIHIVNGYASGADQALAAQELFGRGVDTSSKLLLLNTQAISAATETARDLGLEVGSNAVEAWKAYDDATDRAGFGLKGLGNTIGTAVMPMVTTLIEAFNGAMPVAIKVVGVALSGLTTAFLAVRNGVMVVWETIDSFVFSVTEPLRALASAIYKLVTGDFKGAADEMSNWPSNIAKRWSSALDTMTAESKRTKDQMVALWSSDGVSGTPQGPAAGGKTMPQKANKDKKGAAEKAESIMPLLEAELAERRVAYAKENDLREMSKADELKYWEEVSARHELAESDRISLRRRTTQLEMQLLREMAMQGRQLDEQERLSKQADALHAVQMSEQQAQSEFDNGLMSRQQLLELDRQFEEQRNEIRRQYLLARMQEVDPERDPVEYAKRLEQIEELERQHRLRLSQIQIETTKASPMATVWKQTQQSMEQALTGMLSGQTKFRSAVAQVWAGIRQSIAGELAKIITAKVAGFIRERGIAMAGMGMDAAKAGTGAAASQASIPIVGPALALAAMASVFAAVSGMSSKVPSARGGWSIPSGVNPLTQLHEEEMVLPRDIANPMRDALQNGGMGGSGLPPIHITAMDSRDVVRALKKDGALHRALKELERTNTR